MAVTVETVEYRYPLPTSRIVVSLWPRKPLAMFAEVPSAGNLPARIWGSRSWVTGPGHPTAPAAWLLPATRKPGSAWS